MPLLKKILTSLLLMAMGLRGYCQIAANDSTSILQRELKMSAMDTGRINVLITLGYRYSSDGHSPKEKRDTALTYFNEAYRLSTILKNEPWRHRSMTALAIKEFDSGNIAKGRVLISKVIAYYHRVGDKVREAESWNTYSEQLWSIDSKKYLQECLRNTALARQLYEQVGDPVRLVYLRTWPIKRLMLDRNYSAAEKQCMSMRAECLRLKLVGGSYTWVLNVLSEIAFQQSDLYKQLSFELETLDHFTKHPDAASVYNMESCYYHLATIYYSLGNYAKSELYARKQLPLNIELNNNYAFPLHFIVFSLLKQNRPQAALHILNKTISHTEQNSEQKEMLNRQYGYVYLALKKFTLAEKAFKTSVETHNLSDPEHQELSGFSASYRAMGDFYFLRGQYSLAKPYFAALEKINLKLPPSYQIQFARSKSRLDSAEGNYLSALKSFQVFKRLNDSVFNADKTAKLTQLEVAFETREKQNRIDLLDAQNKISSGQVQKTRIERNITIGGLLLLAGILIYMFFSFKAKVRTNRLLNLAKAEIDVRNATLMELVAEKESLIDEKEELLSDKDMLLKEVHHRVKNNLQIVMSLLSTKLVYLENQEAVEAIEESQQRVQSIALIHQKLYKSSGGSTIELKNYLVDMVDDLDNSFNARTRGINFDLQVETIYIDVDQAVPIGLILNEAITNAIKYAFKNTGGNVLISIHKVENDHIKLTVQDNGRGLPKDFSLGSSSTLGMEMMKGLGKQLKGELKITNANGVKIELSFPKIKPIFQTETVVT